MAQPMKLLVSWSSGKDSAWMLHVVRQRYPGVTAALLTTTNEAFDRVAMHAVRRSLVEAQAREAGLPLHVIPLPWPCSNDEYESRMGAAVARLAGEGFTHKMGDIVTIANPKLGALVNRVRHSSDIAPWTFGTGALMTNLARRGLLAEGSRKE